MFVQFNSLDNGYTRQNTDTAIGGEFGLFRFKSLAFPDTQYQIDFMGVHFSRWSERAWAVGGDYRYGFPVTFKSGPWEGKIGYEHTSTHVGDDFIKTHGRYKERYVRDEIVAGLSYRWWNQLRLYGEAAVAMWMASPVEKGSERYDWGFEWSRQEPTGWKGQPFAAFDMDLRPEQDFNPNICLQVGWQWIPCDQRTTSVRLAFEWYDGYAPYGQFFLMKDRWVGVGVFLDF
jgi:hypothetical protein